MDWRCYELTDFVCRFTLLELRLETLFWARVVEFKVGGLLLRSARLRLSCDLLSLLGS